MLNPKRAFSARPLLCLFVVSSALAFDGTHAEAPAAAPTADPACPAAPALALSAGFEDPRGTFGPNSPAFRSVEKRFAAAYRVACRNGGLSAPLMRPGASGAGRLFLKNAPSANTASIYQESFEIEGATGPMVIEFPFIGDDGRSNLPSAEELRSAIVCSVYYANPPSGPVGDVLECLVD
jgi:hypothetical protein